MGSQGRVAEYHDPRIVELYDLLCPFGAEGEFYLALAEELGAESVLDLGCGTGALAVELAAAGRHVVGVDPSDAMLAVARARPGASSVSWVTGGMEAYDGPPVELVIMTGHVAQVIADDSVWTDALAAVHRCLRPGGQLAFESRDPRDRPWERWAADDGEMHRERVHPTHGPVSMTYQHGQIDDGLLRYELHYRFVSSGDVVVSHNELRFRSQHTLTASLVDVGFRIDAVYGDWDRRPPGPGEPELIMVARRPA